MPLYKKISADSFEIAVWRIEEELSFFESKFTVHPGIQNENKKLQWYATRYLLNEMLKVNVSIEKEQSGKPFIKDSPFHISLSHTALFAAVMFSKKLPVGIDLEIVNPKVMRVAHKFLRADEIDSIAEEEKIEKLILYWSAKEALYKFYGKGEVEFTTQLLVEPFELKPKGELVVSIRTDDYPRCNLNMQYEFFAEHVLTYVVGR